MDVTAGCPSRQLLELALFNADVQLKSVREGWRFRVYLLADALPIPKEMIADRGYDADWFRDALKKKGMKPCIPPKKNRKVQYRYDKMLYKQRHKVENMFSHIK